MQIDTAGTYLLKYTAEDSCGNVTEVTREVEAVQITYRTVLYTDGTFIINEKSTDQAANEALHGAATNVYAAFEANGSTATALYNYTDKRNRPWNNQATLIRSVEMGSYVYAYNTAFWFNDLTNCTNINLENLDVSRVTNAGAMFSGVGAEIIDMSGLSWNNLAICNAMFYKDTSLKTIYANESFQNAPITNSDMMFFQMSDNLVGGAGTTWDSSNPTNKTYARIDGGTSNPGYFTARSA